LSPSIWVPGQFVRKNLASAQDVIWEQRVRPSHRNCGDICGSGVVITSDEADACGSGVVVSTGGACGARFVLSAVGADACGSGVVLGVISGAGCLVV